MGIQTADNTGILDIDGILRPFVGGDVEIRNLMCGDGVHRGAIESIVVSEHEIAIRLSRGATKECDGVWNEQDMGHFSARRDLFKVVYSEADSSICLISARLGMTATLYRKGLGTIDWGLVKSVGLVEKIPTDSGDGARVEACHSENELQENSAEIVRACG